MRMLPSRYVVSGKPLQIKRKISSIRHLQAPLKGLSLSSKLIAGDPLQAPILDNWVVEEDRIRVRPGTIRIAHLATPAPISAIVPFYGFPNTYLLASNTNLFTAAAVLFETGFTDDDWAWTAFTNLGSSDFTIMCNGHNGVWSWDGGTNPGPAPVVVTKVAKTNPVQVTVGIADIGKFHEGQSVIMSGVTTVGLTAANGTRAITFAGMPANTFALVGINGTAAAADQTTGTMRADPQGSMAQEAVTAPLTDQWINPLLFSKVCTHMNRLWFADDSNLAVYYLPVQSKTGELKYLPLNALFRRGGSIRAIYPWTVDGGTGLDDQLVVFTDNGECAIYGGTDPDSDFELVGLFRFDSPMSKNSVMQFGGDLYVLTSTGLLPMSTLIRAESEKLGRAEKQIFSAFTDVAVPHRNEYGWGVMLDHHSGRAICNMPLGGGVYRQLVREMSTSIWAQWSNLPSRCWNWIAGRLIFATDRGEVFEINELYLNDDGKEIRADVQFAWSNFGTASTKQFKLVYPHIISDGSPTLYVDIKTDYDITAPANMPDVAIVSVGSDWDTATWNVDQWAGQAAPSGSWQGVTGLGRVAAPRFRVAVKNCTFALSAADVVYEEGSPL